MAARAYVQSHRVDKKSSPKSVLIAPINCRHGEHTTHHWIRAPSRTLALDGCALRLPSVTDDLVAVTLEDDRRIATALLVKLLGAVDVATGCAVSGSIL